MTRRVTSHDLGKSNRALAGIRISSPSGSSRPSKRNGRIHRAGRGERRAFGCSFRSTAGAQLARGVKRSEMGLGFGDNEQRRGGRREEPVQRPQARRRKPAIFGREHWRRARCCAASRSAWCWRSRSWRRWRRLRRRRSSSYVREFAHCDSDRHGRQVRRTSTPTRASPISWSAIQTSPTSIR